MSKPLGTRRQPNSPWKNHGSHRSEFLSEIRDAHEQILLARVPPEYTDTFEEVVGLRAPSVHDPAFLGGFRYQIARPGCDVHLLDANGENAFSFRLNSNHKALVQARLSSADSSVEGREALVLEGARVALDVVAQQTDPARTRQLGRV